MTDIYEGIREIKKYALDHQVPIMQDEGIDFLTDYIAKNQVKKVLEIGTAIGYSAIMMALSNPQLTVVSIERDRDRYLEAVKNVKEMHLDQRITLLYKDAFDVSFQEKFDLIFIDAAKGQNIKFFEKFSYNLADSGTIITDNIYFHGLVDTPLEEIESRSLRSLVRKIKNYICFLNDHPAFQTTFYRIGDGISVSVKKKGRKRKS